MNGGWWGRRAALVAVLLMAPAAARAQDTLIVIDNQYFNGHSAPCPFARNGRSLAEMPENALKKTGELSVIKIRTYIAMLDFRDA